MTKRKAPTTGKTHQSKTQKRASATRASVPAPSVDEDIFIPAAFGQDAAPSCNGVTPDDDNDGAGEDVFIPATFGQHEPDDDVCSWCGEIHGGGPEACPALHPDRAEQFERARLLDRLGFTERGICKYGCRGTESPNIPLVGWHLKTCQFWNDVADALPSEPFH